MTRFYRLMKWFYNLRGWFDTPSLGMFLSSHGHVCFVSGPHDELYTDRRAHCVNAVSAVFQKLPPTQLPHEGNAQETIRTVLPILEQLYDMPAAAPSRGSKGYYKQLLKRPLEATFDELMKDDKLLNAWILQMQVIGDANGAPRLRVGELVPLETYKMTKLVNRGPMLSPKTVSCHPKLRFLRSISHKKAISVLLDKGE